jgi:Holliday junction resolvasome RuvABC endonuclease subunit
MNILALDLSLTAPGICHPDGATETLKIKPALKGMHRLALIRAMVRSTVTTDHVDLVTLEGYSYGSKGRGVINIGELGGVIRLALHEASIPFVEIPPSCLKRYATGRGNADKDAVLQQAVIRAGHVFVDNNAADAWWLWQLALAHYEPGSPLLVRMPKGNLEGLAKVAWVDVRSVAA